MNLLKTFLFSLTLPKNHGIEGVLDNFESLLGDHLYFLRFSLLNIKLLLKLFELVHHLLVLHLHLLDLLPEFLVFTDLRQIALVSFLEIPGDILVLVSHPLVPFVPLIVLLVLFLQQLLPLLIKPCSLQLQLLDLVLVLHLLY